MNLHPSEESGDLDERRIDAAGVLVYPLSAAERADAVHLILRHRLCGPIIHLTGVALISIHCGTGLPGLKFFQVNTIRTTGRWPIGLTPGLFWSAVAIVLAAVTAQAEGAVDATADYDPGNIFARIVRGEAPADIVFENEYAIAFHDIAPRREIHVLVIPKGPYTNILHFNAEASDGEKLALLDAISETARIMGVADSGFRLVSNTGEGGHQTVPHLHFHLLGGKPPDEVD